MIKRKTRYIYIADKIDIVHNAVTSVMQQSHSVTKIFLRSGCSIDIFSWSDLVNLHER